MGQAYVMSLPICMVNLVKAFGLWRGGVSYDKDNKGGSWIRRDSRFAFTLGKSGPMAVRGRSARYSVS